MIQTQVRLQLLVRQQLASDGTKRFLKTRQALFTNRQTRCHLVTAKFLKMSRTYFKCPNKMKTCNTPGASLAYSRLIERDDRGRTVIFSSNPRRHDSDNTLVPSPLANDNGSVPGRVKCGADLFFCRNQRL